MEGKKRTCPRCGAELDDSWKCPDCKYRAAMPRKKTHNGKTGAVTPEGRAAARRKG